MRILVSLDYGAPTELIRDALTVGAALEAKGHKAIYVVGDPVAFVDQAGSWTPSELHQAPVLSATPSLVMKRPPVDGFADQMAMAGFDDRQTLQTLASIWHRQLEGLKPDLIVGFSTPVLWLIGQFHAPTVAIGNGFSVPPVLGTSFPRMSVNSTPLADENVMLANANAVLARFGMPALAALSEVMKGCTPILYGPPTLDPYLQLRRTLTIGLLGDSPQPTIPPTKPRLAVFLDVQCPGVEAIVLAVSGLGAIPVDINISGVTTGMRRFLEQQPHIKFWTSHAALLAQVETASALVHHGVHDVAQRCLTKGRPQLMIPWKREQEILTYMVGWMSFSWTKPATTEVSEMSAAMRDLLRDNSLVVAAQHHARQFADTNLPNALPVIVEQLEKLAEA